MECFGDDFLSVKILSVKKSDFNAYEPTGQPSALARSRGHAKASPRLTPPLYKAVVEELAESGKTGVSSSTSDIDKTILERIKKCLDRAHHPGTPEVEAKVAIFRASRLMGQYNVTQAEILAHEPLSTQRNYAGQSVVSIVRSDGNLLKSVKHQGYVDQLCCAINEFFDCKHYSTSYSHCVKLTFYGIAQNTITAALSFEMVYNLITKWAMSYKGIGRRNSYTLGAADELRRMARIKKAAELAEAKATEDEAIKAKLKQEEIERQAQLDRLAPHAGEQVRLYSPEPEPELAYENTHSDVDSDDMTIYEDAYDVIDDDSDDDVEPDFKIEDEDTYNSLDLDEEILNFVSNNPQSTMQASGLSAAAPAPNTQELSVPAQNVIASTDPDAELESKWASQMQLVIFRATATKMADDYLKYKGIRIVKGRRRSNVIRDQGAYKLGVRDGKKIDVHKKCTQAPEIGFPKHSV
ncbi:hypothetical protein ACLOAV_010681 [Pseudogymnoascus australis]